MATFHPGATRGHRCFVGVSGYIIMRVRRVSIVGSLPETPVAPHQGENGPFLTQNSHFWSLFDGCEIWSVTFDHFLARRHMVTLNGFPCPRVHKYDSYEGFWGLITLRDLCDGCGGSKLPILTKVDPGCCWGSVGVQQGWHGVKNGQKIEFSKMVTGCQNPPRTGLKPFWDPWKPVFWARNAPYSPWNKPVRVQFWAL